MRTLAIALAFGGLLYSMDARADASSGLTLGARLGYGIPMGDGGKPGGQSIALSKYTTGSIPLVVEAGYRFTPEISAGAYFQYAYAMASNSGICDTIGGGALGATCTSTSASVMRYGIQGADRFVMPGMTPWVGIGLGTETAKLETTVNFPAGVVAPVPVSQKVTVKPSTDVVGDFNIQGGIDWSVAPGMSVGPFVTLTFAKYTKATTSPSNGTSDSIPSSDQAWHEWLILGVKGTFDL